MKVARYLLIPAAQVDKLKECKTQFDAFGEQESLAAAGKEFFVAKIIKAKKVAEPKDVVELAAQVVNEIPIAQEIK